MKQNEFVERVCSVCKREVRFFESGNFAVQTHPNPYDITLRFRVLDGLLYADISHPESNRWILLFQETNDPRYNYHLQENTEIDGLDGIIDHCYSKTLPAALNALKRVLDSLQKNK